MQLASGRVVTSTIDPFAAYNWAFGIRRGLDLPGAVAAFRLAGRDYVHVRCSPSSRPHLAPELAELGFSFGWTEVYRRSMGTGEGERGLTRLARAEFDHFFAVWRSAWGRQHDPTAAYANTYDQKSWPPNYGGRNKPYDFEGGNLASSPGRDPDNGYLRSTRPSTRPWQCSAPSS